MIKLKSILSLSKCGGLLPSLGKCQCTAFSTLMLQNHVYSMSYSQSSRSLSSTSSPFLCEKLKNRHLIEISGQEPGSFLQGLVTNDVNLLYENQDSLSAMYAMILNVKGRVLYDLIIYRLSSQPDSLLVECNADVTDDLIKILKRYKLRKKLDLTPVSDKINVWAAFSSKFDPQYTNAIECQIKDKSKLVGIAADPRLNYFGYRLLLPASVSDGSSVLENGSICEGVYESRRYQLGLSEGTSDLPPSECLPLESNLAFLNGVSFDKGCYVGQELTARTQYTGVIRKRLMPLKASSDVSMDKGLTVENSTGKSCGKVRQFVGRHGLGLLRVEEVMGSGPLVIKNSSSQVVAEAETFIPHWWKTETDQIMKKTIAKQSEDDN